MGGMLASPTGLSFDTCIILSRTLIRTHIYISYIHIAIAPCIVNMYTVSAHSSRWGRTIGLSWNQRGGD
jgi:hypothetical protein